MSNNEHLIGKIVNQPNASRVPKSHIGTLQELKSIDAITKWIAKQGWNVFFEKKALSMIDPGLRNVIISSSENRSNILYTLLHEAGHINIRIAGLDETKYKDGYNTLSRNRRTLKYKVDVLAEEIDAWEHGIAIAKHLRIKLNMDGYKAARNRAIKTYIEWANQK